jgi:heme/copper-type cytochrome/quinol oxidase subunit 2
MHVAILWLCIALASAVFGIMLYSVVAYRGPQGKLRRRGLFVELMWAAVPIAIMVVAAWPVLREMVAPMPPAVAASHE